MSAFDELRTIGNVAKAQEDVQNASEVASEFIRIVSNNSVRLILARGSIVLYDKALPEYGETEVITHRGKVTYVETSTKEKVE